MRRTVTLAGAKPRHLGVTVSPIAAPDGDLKAAVCLFTDLTAVVELEEQLRLKEALARLGELTAGIAHEFRNGLATIHGYGRLLDPLTLPDQARKCVDGIRAETTALGEVVTNFLRFARPEQMTHGARRSARGDRARHRRRARRSGNGRTRGQLRHHRWRRRAAAAGIQ